jgi:hypothetical protein
MTQILSSPEEDRLRAKYAQTVPNSSIGRKNIEIGENIFVAG